MITKKNIEQLAKEIMDFLEKNDLAGDVCIYFNNKRFCSETEILNNSYDVRYAWVKEDNINPHDYFTYCAYNHILSMSFEGSFYEVLNYSGGIYLNKFNEILSKYSVYYELGDAWNLSVYPDGDKTIDDFEYTEYKKPKEKIKLYMRCVDEYDPSIANIMKAWYELSKQTGDIGSCVIGAGFEFNLNGNEYWMSSCSPWQGSCSWEKHVPVIRNMLETIGATNVYFNYGILD